MSWELVRLNSGRCSLENYKLEADALPEVLSVLEKAFGERMKFNGMFGLDFALAFSAVELLIDGARITLGHDIWSGVFIMAWDECGDRIVENSIKTLLRGSG